MGGEHHRICRGYSHVARRICLHLVFTYLLFCQSASRGNVLAALVSAGTVAVLKAVGAAGVAVPVAAVAGVIIAVVAGVFTPVSADKGGE